MRDFLFFLGRFHVLALHLPIGAILAAVALDVLSARPRYAKLAAAVPFTWGLAAASAVLAAVLGYLHFAEGGFDGHSANLHRLYGTATAVAAVLAWRLARSPPARYRGVRLAADAVLVGLVFVTGHHGGNLTHGSAYLVEHAPAPLRRLAGGGSEGAEGTPAAHGASGGREDPALVARLREAGFLVRPVAQDDARLVVSVYSPGTELGPGELAALLAAADHIVDLNLQDAGLDDADLQGFERLTALSRLRLSGNRLTDAALPRLAALPKLEHLNLYGNEGITDAGLEHLAGSASLRRLYLWGTRVTAAGAARVGERRVDLAIVVEAANPLIEAAQQSR